MKTWLFIPGGRDDFFGRSFEPFPVGDGHTAYEWAMALARSSALIDATTCSGNGGSWAMHGRSFAPHPLLDAALRVSGGVYAHAAKLLSEATGRSCTRQNIQHWIRKHPILTETVREAVEEIKDLAETALIENIRNRDTSAIKFYLETKAKDRGYVRQYKVTGAQGQPLTAPPSQVVVYIPDNGRDPKIVKTITHAEYLTKRNGASTA